MSLQVFRHFVRAIETGDFAWKGYLWIALLFITATAQGNAVVKKISSVFIFCLILASKQPNLVIQAKHLKTLFSLQYCVQVTVSNHYFRQAYVSAFQMRTAVISAIYKKSFTISSASRKHFTTGEITNLMAVDASTFLDIIPFINTVWSGPFQFALALYLLYELVGVSALAGLTVFFIMVPVNLLSSSFGKTFQANQMKAKDGRVLLMNEILQGIKVLKLYAWEIPFMKRVEEFRVKEITSIKQNGVLQAFLYLTFSAAPLFLTLATFICYVFIDPDNNILTAEKVFGTVAIYNVVRMPMNQFPRFLMDSIKLYVSVKRIDNFLNATDLNSNDGNAILEKPKLNIGEVKMNNASFTWQNDSQKPTLADINLNVYKGELIAVVGKIASGKSSLLAAILGEMKQISGESLHCGKISYVSQQAWIQNLTLRENILFGTAYCKERYEKVVKVCALEPDISLLSYGDQTEIGENGVNLSGGQKQRISLARAAYSYSDIVLMDDPLSAVDAHVAKHIFEQLIGPSGFLKDRTRILVTHALGFLHDVSKILLFDEGQLIQSGTLQNLTIAKNEKFIELLQFIGQENKVTRKEEKNVPQKEEESKDVEKDSQNIICVEKAALGRVNSKHYVFYFKSMNAFCCIIVMILFLASEALKAVSNLVLAYWTSQFHPSTTWSFIGYYALSTCLCSFCGVMSQIGISLRSAAASKKIHNSLLEKIMHAPLIFFESNPVGRILNRFTSDVDILDVRIPILLRQFLMCLCMILGAFGVAASVTPIFLAPLVPIIIGFILLQIFFSKTRRQVKRLESIAKSPIFSHFTETISGVSSIRAFGQTERFCQESERRVANHLHCNYISEMSNRWLSIRVETIGNIIVLLAAVFAFYNRDSLSAGLAALSVSYAMQTIDGLGWTIRLVQFNFLNFCFANLINFVYSFLSCSAFKMSSFHLNHRVAGELEADSVALERIREYEALPQEREWKTDFPLSKVKIFINMTFQDKSFTGESLMPLDFNIF